MIFRYFEDEKMSPFLQIYIIFIDPVLIYMIKIRSRSLSQIPRSHTSSACIKNRLGGSREFIPFHQERDQIGRLLKPPKFNETNIVVQDSSSSEAIDMPKKAEKKLEDKINQYFQMSRLPLPIYDLQKSKILKKTMISVPVNHNIPKNLIKKQSTDDKMVITDEKSVMLSRQFSKANWQFSQKPQLGIKRMQSSIIPRGNFIFSPPKNMNTSKQIFSLQNTSIPKKVDLSLEKFAELNRYHRWQELQMKTYSNFQQGHTKFIQKILQTKKLAFDVRINLDKIDALC